MGGAVEDGSHASFVSSATTVLRSSMSISIHAAARSMQHHNWADSSRSCTADVSWQRRDLVTPRFAPGALKNVYLNAVSLFNTFVFFGRFHNYTVWFGLHQKRSWCGPFELV